ncbi:pumilio homolog 3 [Athalia rosae]|uniref:pumilio homolog 3 n=1 Tax=Athalia rosae TaxID=37344 RepID=UPI00203338E0|nr:pumilio homolog 3 [Athalia rosae]XP_012265666.2 pumilio homolog 3 [Athalia rosae]
MKRKDQEKTDVEPKTKKIKKSVGFSDKVNSDKISNVKTKKALVVPVKDGIKAQKVKFQKPTAAKKSDKGDKSKKFNKQVGKNKLKGSDADSKTSITNASEKPDWLEFKKQKKLLKETRRAKRLSEAYDVTVKAKKIGEILRRADCSKEEREEHTVQLFKLLEGQFGKIVFMHDMARIVQWLLKYCSAETRESILSELKDSIVLMLQSKYAKNCIKIMLDYGTAKIRETIIKACNGHIIKLISHSVAAPIVELAYSTWATDKDKLYFKQEFYGDMYKQAKDNEIKTLSDVYKSSPDMKSATLSAVKSNLVKILNKKVINTALVHSVLLEFLKNCTNEDRDEMIVMFRSFIVELSRTKDGTEVAIICLRHGTNKDKKIAMKALKDQVKTLATNEHGHMVLLALFDYVDDTVLVKKMVLSELQENVTEIALHEHGRSVILYLVARRDLHYFHPKLVEQLKQGDENATSKKSSEVREKELLDAVITKFLTTVATETAAWLSNSSISMVTLAILKVGDGESLINAYEAISNYITDPESIITENKVHHKAIEYSGLHMMLKKLIQHDKVLMKEEKPTFGETLIERLETAVIKQWVEFNRGCFILITLLENSTQSNSDRLIAKLKPLIKVLKSKKTPGALILLKKLQ